MDLRKHPLTLVVGIFTACVFVTSCSASNSIDECTDGTYSEYRKVIVNPSSRIEEDQFVVVEEMLNSTELENIIFVLKYYRKMHKVIDSRLLIDCGLWRDKDLLANFHEKSKDSEWLGSHGKD